jgi:hypothetical protein
VVVPLVPLLLRNHKESNFSITASPASDEITIPVFSTGID